MSLLSYLLLVTTDKVILGIDLSV